MAVMLSEVYDALREAGASEASARRAAEAVAVRETRFDQLDARIAGFEQRTEARIAGFEQRTEARFVALEARFEARFDVFEQRTNARFAAVDGRFVALEARFEARFDAIETRLTRLEGEVALIKWMLGTVGALSIAILVKLFTI